MKEKELEDKFQEDFQLIFNFEYIDSAAYRHDFSIYKAGYERALKDITNKMNKKVEEVLERIEVRKNESILQKIKKVFNEN